MSLAEKLLLIAIAAVPVVIAVWMFYAPRNKKRDANTPGWRVVTRQFGREQRTKAMPKERALTLASRLIYGAVQVVRLDNDAAGTTMSLDEIRAPMEENQPHT